MGGPRTVKSLVRAHLDLSFSSGLRCLSIELSLLSMGNLAGQIAIFWDFENCRPSFNVPGHKVIDNIRRLVQSLGCIASFRAYLDISLECTFQRSGTLFPELQSSGVTLIHCPHNGKKDVADKMMLVDMLAFAIDKPAPATIVVITGDRDFAYGAAVLRLRGYQIIVIAPPSAAHSSIKLQSDLLYDWQKDVLDMSDLRVHSSKSDDVALWAKGDVQHCRGSAHSRGSSKECMDSFHQSQGYSLMEPSLSAPSLEQTGEATADGMQTSTASEPVSPPLFFDPYTEVTGGCPGDSGGVHEHIPGRLNELVNQDNSLSRLGPSCESATSSFASVGSNTPEFSDMDTDSKLGGRTDDIPFLREGANTTMDSTGTFVEDQNRLPDSSSVTECLVISTKSQPSVESPSATKTVGITPNARERFWTLIAFFRERRALNLPTRIPSSEVATEIKKRDWHVYEKARVTSLKPYIEEARKAGIVITTGLDGYGSAWVEIDPMLYLETEGPPTAGDAITSKASTKSTGLVSGRSIDAVYAPLILRLQSVAPPHRLLYSALGMFIKQQYPDLYERASVPGLAAYLHNAEKLDIIRTGRGVLPGSEWAELLPVYHEPEKISFELRDVFSGSNSQ